MIRQDHSISAGLEMFPIAEPPNAHVRTDSLHGQRATPVPPIRAMDLDSTPQEDADRYMDHGNRLVSSPLNINAIPSSKQLGTTSDPSQVPRASPDEKEEYKLGGIRGTPGKSSFDQQVMDEGPATTGTLQALSISLGQEVRDGSNHNPESVTM
ncbi:hypothetical protein PG999_002824 [Apiospora kogelbergensis]|uniref:Uncharacterized protein n=1 Tax=Apiospora kogelbergensis TaxID=1337665 RepID=A0AAW0R9G1_9PEZI